MSRLENTNKPHLGLLLQDFSLALDLIQQEHLARWAMKTAMILDSVEGHHHFYNKEDCEKLKTEGRIPRGSLIWIGRFYGNLLDGSAADFSADADKLHKVGQGSVTNIGVGHLVFQVFSLRVRPEHGNTALRIRANPGRWDESLIQIWPRMNRTISWPPPLSFTLSGPLSYGRLQARWRPSI